MASFIAALAKKASEKVLRQPYYGPVSPDGRQRQEFAAEVSKLLTDRIGSGKVSRHNAFAVLRDEIEFEQEANARRIEARNTTTPRVFSGNLPEPKFKFPFSRRKD